MGQTGGGEHDVVAADDDAALGPAAQRRAHEPAHGERRLHHARHRPEQRGDERQPAQRRDGVAGDLVVRRARPLGERAQQMAGVQQHERAGHGAHDDERAQAERGRPHEAGGGRIRALEREQMRKDDPYGRDGGDERRDGHRIRSTATSSASRPSSAASSRGRLPMSCAMAT